MSERPPGFEEYTPSRLEWLVVMLNSYVHYINTMPVNILRTCSLLGRTETLLNNAYEAFCRFTFGHCGL